MITNFMAQDQSIDNFFYESLWKVQIETKILMFFSFVNWHVNDFVAILNILHWSETVNDAAFSIFLKTWEQTDYFNWWLGGGEEQLSPASQWV